MVELGTAFAGIETLPGAYRFVDRICLREVHGMGSH